MYKYNHMDWLKIKQCYQNIRYWATNCSNVSYSVNKIDNIVLK